MTLDCPRQFQAARSPEKTRATGWPQNSWEGAAIAVAALFYLSIAPPSAMAMRIDAPRTLPDMIPNWSVDWTSAEGGAPVALLIAAATLAFLVARGRMLHVLSAAGLVVVLLVAGFDGATDAPRGFSATFGAIAGLGAALVIACAFAGNSTVPAPIDEPPPGDPLAAIGAAIARHGSIVYADEAGRLTSVSERAAELIGRPQTALVGTRAVRLVQLQHCGEAVRALRDAIDSAGVWSGRLCLGVERWERTQVFAIAARLPDREVAILLEPVARDRAKSSTVSGDEADARLGDQEFLTAAVSHDLKAPLMTVLALAHNLLRNEDIVSDPQTRGVVERIRAAADLMEGRVESLLEFTRIGHVTPRREVVDLPAVCKEVLTIVRLLSGETKVDISTDLQVREIYADRARLVQILQNLLDNALRHAQSVPHPTVELGSRRVRGEVLIYVRDNGPGVPESEQEAIFQLFQRGDADARGHGVGLALVRRIAFAHGGRAWVESKPGQGATFWVSLGHSK